MTIPKELEAKILRYFHAEQWKVGTIARQLGVHHGTVDRVLSQAGLPKLELTARDGGHAGNAGAVPGEPHRPSQLDPFLAFVRETLERYPRLTASRLYAMVRERGYSGGPDHFRHLMQHYRPRAQAEAYLRLKTLPGEQGQVDWAHFGKHRVGRAERPLMAFVMVLSWSRQIHLQFFLDARMASFLRGHEATFRAWGGLPRVLLYDNLKSAVLERQGDAIRFHPTLLAFAAHYRFEPRPVAVARGNEKDRVERAIRYVRHSFFPARTWRDLDDLNAQAEAWCLGQAADRPCHEERTVSVREAFEQERPKLLALPDNPFATEERLEVKVGKTPYVRFDLNDYSLPPTHIQRRVVVVAAAERGENLGSLTAALLRLLDAYGASELGAAIAEALACGVPHPNAVRLSLERRREQRHQPPPSPVSLPEDPRVRDASVRPHALAGYDGLTATQESSHDDPAA